MAHISVIRLLFSLISTVSVIWCIKREVLDKPNIILIVIDDVGYGDLSSYGHPTQEFNAVDQLAREGVRFTQWYATASLCTPSRAAMLTGRLPVEMGMKQPFVVHLPCHTVGLPKSQMTIANLLKSGGYRTGIVGKWHLGINEHHFEDGAFLPHNYGFDDVKTILPFTLAWDCDTKQRHRRHPLRRACFLYYNRTIVQQPLDLDHLSITLLSDAKAFVHDNVNRPFFLFFSLPQAHTPMFNMKQFINSSRRGIYGDQLNEMAWIVGELKSLLQKEGLERNTLLLVVSDNGPNRELCEEGGSPGMFRGSKGYYFEGGVRVPAIAWWPGVIEPGRVDNTVISNLDILPTFADLAGIKSSVPHSRGKSLSDILLTGLQNFTSLHEALFFYDNDLLMAVRYKNFKIHFRKYPDVDQAVLRSVCRGNFPLINFLPVETFDEVLLLEEPEIYNIELDPGEEHALPVEDHINLLKFVYQEIEEFERQLPQRFTRAELVDKCSSLVIPCCNPPFCICNYPGTFHHSTPMHN